MVCGIMLLKGGANMAGRELDPIVGQFPDPKKVKCKDCFLRDRTTVTIGKKTSAVGITKSYCSAFLPPPVSNGKPREVLYYNEDCPYYQKDDTAT